MSGIKSDITGASQKATAIQKAVQSIVSNQTVTNDAQTTVAGNKMAQEAIQSAQEAALQISQAVASASKNLQSVAENFEALDQTLEKSILQPFGGFNK